MKTFGTEKVNQAVETFAGRTADSYRLVVDHVVGLQGRNVRYARGVWSDFAGEFRQQAEANRAMTQELIERTRGQRKAFRTVVEESVGVYRNVAFAPFAYYRRGVEQVAQQAEQQAEVAKQAAQVAPVSDISTGLPIANYDELTVSEISQKLDGLSAEDIKKVRVYEKGHKDRDTLVGQIDRKIKAAS